MNKYGFVNIADFPGRKISKAYQTFKLGISIEAIIGKTKLSSPISFLVNQDGKIVWKYIGTRTDRPPNDVILKAIEEFL